LLEPTESVPAPLRGGSGEESEVWDRQFIMDALLRTLPKACGGDAAVAALERRACLELLEDAEAEGICWVEVGYKAFDFSEETPGEITSQSLEEWRHALAIRREAMEKHPDVGMGYIVSCPKGTHQDVMARAILAFFEHEGERAALAGVGKWGREAPGIVDSHGPALATFLAAGVPLAMLHAGEGYGATGGKIPAESYDGATLVEEAVSVGALRIGHGIEAARRSSTMDLLRERGVCLEVCLYSNWLLAMAPWEDDAAGQPHPLPRLLEARVPCCLAADDPTLMGAASSHGLLREYEAARRILGLSDDQLAGLASCSVKFSGMPEFLKVKALMQIGFWLSEDASSA